jgi:hypothetical protein
MTNNDHGHRDDFTAGTTSSDQPVSSDNHRSVLPGRSAEGWTVQTSSRRKKSHLNNSRQDGPVAGRVDAVLPRSSTQTRPSLGEVDLRGRTSPRMEQSKLVDHVASLKDSSLSQDELFRIRPIGQQQSCMGATSHALGKNKQHHSERTRGQASIICDDESKGGRANSSLAVHSVPSSSRRNDDAPLAFGGKASIDRSTREEFRILSLAPLRLLQTVTTFAGDAWNSFFYDRTDNLQMAGVIRIAFSIVLLFNLILLGLDFDWFFLEVLPTKLAVRTLDPDTLTILTWIPEEHSEVGLWTCYLLSIVQVILLGLGIAPRFQACGTFFWLAVFRHHNNIIWDGEDQVFRLLAFFLIFFPLHRVTIYEWVGRPATHEDGKGPTKDSWPMVCCCY